MTTRQDQLLRLFGAKPLLIEASKLDAAYAARRPYAFQDGVAVVDIAGILANEPSLFEAVFLGATAYGQILDEVEQAVADPEVRGILLRINSPGGDSDNAFKTAVAINRLAKERPIWAVADNSVFSAAYLLATSAEKIYVPEFTGGVGSVGVYAEHVDWSEYNRKLGVKVTYIAEGEGKTDGNPNEPLSDPRGVHLARRFPDSTDSSRVPSPVGGVSLRMPSANSAPPASTVPRPSRQASQTGRARFAMR